MKLTTVLSLLLCASFCQTHAQLSWADDQAEWYYFYQNFWTGSGHAIFSTSGDSIIDGQLCTKILNSVFYIDYNGDSIQENWTDRWIYQSGDTIWSYRNNVFHQLYNFSLQPGDTADFSNTFCWDGFICIVEDTGTVNFNGMILRNQTIVMYDDQFQQVNEFEIIEKLGMVNLPYPFFWDSTCPFVIDGPEWQLLCYTDSVHQDILLGSQPCIKWGTPTNIDPSVFQIDVNVFPNPGFGTFEIETSHPFLDVEVYRISGEQVARFSYIAHGDRIDISGFSDGLYVFKFHADGNMGIRKVMKISN